MRFFVFLLGCLLLVVGATIALTTMDQRINAIGIGTAISGFGMIWLSLHSRSKNGELTD